MDSTIMGRDPTGPQETRPRGARKRATTSYEQCAAAYSAFHWARRLNFSDGHGITFGELDGFR